MMDICRMIRSKILFLIWKNKIKVIKCMFVMFMEFVVNVEVKNKLFDN